MDNILNTIYKLYDEFEDNDNIDENSLKIKELHKIFYELKKEDDTEKIRILNHHFIQNKVNNYIFLDIMNKDILIQMQKIYIIYKPYISELVDKICETINQNLLNTEYSVDIKDWIKYPSNYSYYIKRQGFLIYLLNTIYQLLSYYIFLNLFKISISEKNLYFKGIISDSINIYTCYVIKESRTQEEFEIKSIELIKFFIENNEYFNGTEIESIIISNSDYEYINYIIEENNLNSLVIYDKLNIDTLIISGSILEINDLENIISKDNENDNYIFLYEDKKKNNIINRNNIFTLKEDLKKLHKRCKFLNQECKKETLEIILNNKSNKDMNMNNIFKKLYNIHRSINIIDLTSNNVNKYLEEIFLNIYGTGSKWLAFNLLNELEWKNKIYSIKYFFRTDIHNLFKYDNWVEKYTPKIVKNSMNMLISNKFTDYFKTPPIIIGGILSYISNINLITKAYCNGYFCEISTLELVDSFIFRTKVHRITKNIPSGEAIIINIDNIEENYWKFFLTIQLKIEGLPVGGLCIMGKLPIFENFIRIIDELYKNNITVLGIYVDKTEDYDLIVKLSKYNKNMIILCYCNSYYSIEKKRKKYETIIIKKYHYLRNCENIFIICSVDYSNINNIYTYFTGEWSLKYCFNKMPFDALCINYLLFSTNESTLSNSVKQNIQEKLYNISDDNGEITHYSISTIKYENEKRHVFKTEASSLWNYLYENFFYLPKNERRIKIFENKKIIIEKLEKYYMKKYLGDLSLMTYYDLLRRCVNLLTCNNSSDWIHIHYEWKMKDLIKWILGKFQINLSIGYEQDAFNILQYIEDNMNCYSLKPIFTELLSTIDINFFLKLCNKEFNKPVNFIPIIDENLEYWFTLDIFQYCEELNSVPYYDYQKTIILLTKLENKENKYFNLNIEKYLSLLNKELIEKLKNTGIEIIDSKENHNIKIRKQINISNELIEKKSIINYILNHKDNVSTALIDLIKQPDIYKSYFECINNYIPNVITTEDVYIELYYDEIKFLNIEKKKILNLRYYDDQSKLRLEIPLNRIGNYQDNIIFCVYYIYKKDCWKYPIQEDKNKLVQCNKLLSSLINSHIIKKNKNVFFIKPEAITNFQKCTKIINKFNLYINYIISCIISKIYIWLFENHSINLLGSIHKSHEFELIDKNVDILNITKIEFFANIRNITTYNKITELLLYINICSNNNNIAILKLTLQLTYNINIPFKPICEYSYILDITIPIIFKFVLEYPGFRINPEINLQDYSYINIEMKYEDNLFHGKILYNNNQIGIIEFFDKKHLEIFKQYGKLYKKPIYYNEIKNISKKSIYITPDYLYFLSLINEINPIYLDNKIANFYNLSFKIINGMWLLAQSFNSIDKEINSYKVRFEKPYNNNEKIEIIYDNIGYNLGSELNSIKILDNNKNEIMNSELSYKIDKIIYLFSGEGILNDKNSNNILLKSSNYLHIINKADNYLKQKYGISLIYIYNTNPKEYKVLLDDNMKTIYYSQGLIDNININYYIFSDENGVINHPLLFQIYSIIYEKALFIEKQYNSLIHSEYYFTGYGLGEYASLFICTDILTIEQIIDFLFRLGSILYNNIEKDYKTITIYIENKNIKEQDLENIINILNDNKNINLSITSYNIINKQYNITGKIIDLIILNEYLENKDIRKTKKIKDLYSKLQKKSVNEFKTKSFEYSISKTNIPYHTSDLNILKDKIYYLISEYLENSEIDPELLEKRYICSLVIDKFEITLKFLEKLQSITNCSELLKLKKEWNNLDIKIKVKKLLSTILTYIVLKPIKWINVQQYIINNNFKKSFEFGNMDILTKMLDITCNISKYKMDCIFMLNDYILKDAKNNYIVSDSDSDSELNSELFLDINDLG